MADKGKVLFGENGVVLPQSGETRPKSYAQLDQVRAAKEDRDWLYPRDKFNRRKLFAWLLAGPLNPVFWGLTFPFSGGISPFTFWGFITVWPCSLGMALLLWRLPQAPIRANKLTGMAFAWAMATIIWYTLALACIGLIGPGLSGAYDGGKISQFLLSTAFVLPFAAIVGFLPALFFGALASPVISVLLYSRAPSDPVAAAFD